MACRIVVIGTSLGGLAALETILECLPPDFPAPVVAVQHRMPDSKSTMTHLLQLHTRLNVKEPQDKEPACAGNVYVAPADYHLLIEERAFSLSTEGPVVAARPSIDVLFESAADSYGDDAVGVILTGASADGAAGASRIKQAGGRLIVQDPSTAECGVMPRSAIAAADVDSVMDLKDIGPELVRLAMSDEDDGTRE